MPLRFVNPNFHVILIHYPLGVFVLGVFLELFSFLWRRSTVRIAARWMIVVGALLTLPSALSGIYALHQVSVEQGLTDASYHFLRWHVIYMGSASILAVVCAVIGLGASDKWRRTLYFPLLLGMVAAWGLMVVGAWHGGETIYQTGTSVAIISNTPRPQTLQALPTPEPHSLTSYDDVVDYYNGGDLQMHMIIAGFAFAIAMGALGLSMRRMNAGPALDEDLIITQPVATTRGGAVALGSPRIEPRRVTDDISVIRSFNPEAAVGTTVIAVAVPSGRWWLLATLALLAALAAGYWTQTGPDILKASGWDTFKRSVHQFHPADMENRALAHAALGASLVVLALICALLAVAAPKQPLLLAFFGMLLVLVIATQVFMGVLLTFDGSKGPLIRFKTAADVEAIHRLKPHKTSDESEPAETAPADASLVPSVTTLPTSLSPSTLPTLTLPVPPTAPTTPPLPATVPDTLPATLPAAVPSIPATLPAVPSATLPATLPASLPSTEPAPVPTPPSAPPEAK